MEVQNNLEYMFDEFEADTLEVWLKDFNFVSNKCKSKLINLYNEVKKQQEKQIENG
jgi:site-specific DNA-adenine methylase